VLYALGAIRNVGMQAMEHLAEVRRAGGPFLDLFDFLERIDPRCVNKRALENLARAGAFDSIHPNRASILAGADVLTAAERPGLAFLRWIPGSVRCSWTRSLRPSAST
jgi:DNA polymerase-3 subunit alpha